MGDGLTTRLSRRETAIAGLEAEPATKSLELANVLKTACKRGSMIVSQARELVEHIDALPITVDAQPPTAPAVLALALRHDLSSYDAAYLELGRALRLPCPIATQDAALDDAAWAAGVGIVA